MDTTLQRKKPSSRKKSCNKNIETVLKITSNAWWPFDRADGKLLEKLHKEHNKVQETPAPF